jgi:hypothetical protein
VIRQGQKTLLGCRSPHVLQSQTTVSLIPLHGEWGQGNVDCKLNAFRVFDASHSNQDFYPSSTRLLVRVEHSGMHSPNNCNFPFKLKLLPTFHVDVDDRHSNWKARWQLFRRSANSVGWHFEITQNYEDQLALSAITKAVDRNGIITKIPPTVGLEDGIPDFKKSVPSSLVR